MATTITADQDNKNYVLGRGRVLFDRFPLGVAIDNDTVGEGYRYVGNSPEFSITSSAEDLEHFDSDEGVKTKDASVQLSLDRSGAFNCDNINAENIALLLQGSKFTLAVVAAAAVVEVIKVKKGRNFQLGQSEALPSGHRKVTITTVKSGSPGFAVTVDAAGNYEVDTDLGLLYIESDSDDIDDDMLVQVTYAVAASSREQVISSSDAIYGQIKFVANNPTGENRDYYMPYVKLAPDGDYTLKGDDWQVIGFTMDVLKRGSLEAMYVDGRAVTA